MLSILLSLVSICILVAEFWLGIAVTGWQGELLWLERSEAPGPYWAIMSLHTLAGIGVPALAFIAGG